MCGAALYIPVGESVRPHGVLYLLHRFHHLFNGSCYLGVSFFSSFASLQLQVLISTLPTTSLHPETPLPFADAPHTPWITQSHPSATEPKQNRLELPFFGRSGSKYNGFFNGKCHTLKKKEYAHPVKRSLDGFWINKISKNKMIEKDKIHTC